MDREHDNAISLGAVPTKKCPCRHSERRPRLNTFVTWMSLAFQALLDAPQAICYRNQRLSEDAIVHACAKAWTVWVTNPGYFCSPLHLVNWLKLVAYRMMVDCHRKNQRFRQWSLPDSKADELTDPRFPQEQQQRWTDADQQTVWGCLQQLPEMERRILEGRYYDHLTDVELASRLFGDPAPSAAAGLRVWRLRQKALAHLGQVLREHGVGSDS